MPVDALVGEQSCRDRVGAVHMAIAFSEHLCSSENAHRFRALATLAQLDNPDATAVGAGDGLGVAMPIPRRTGVLLRF